MAGISRIQLQKSECGGADGKCMLSHNTLDIHTHGCVVVLVIVFGSVEL